MELKKFDKPASEKDPTSDWIPPKVKKEDSLVICSNNLPFKYTSSFIKNGIRECADRLENHTSSFHGFNSALKH